MVPVGAVGLIVRDTIENVKRGHPYVVLELVQISGNRVNAYPPAELSPIPAFLKEQGTVKGHRD